MHSAADIGIYSTLIDLYLSGNIEIFYKKYYELDTKKVTKFWLYCYYDAPQYSDLAPKMAAYLINGKIN